LPHIAAVKRAVTRRAVEIPFDRALLGIVTDRRHFRIPDVFGDTVFEMASIGALTSS
jgi:hypothetical protein